MNKVILIGRLVKNPEVRQDAKRAFEAFTRMSIKSKYYGQIIDYCVELVEED